MKVLRGKVESGVGDFGQWVEKLPAHYEQKTGMKLYPGTLNIRLANTYTIAAGYIRVGGARVWRYGEREHRAVSSSWAAWIHSAYRR